MTGRVVVSPASRAAWWGSVAAAAAALLWGALLIAGVVVWTRHPVWATIASAGFAAAALLLIATAGSARSSFLVEPRWRDVPVRCRLRLVRDVRAGRPVDPEAVAHVEVWLTRTLRAGLWVPPYLLVVVGQTAALYAGSTDPPGWATWLVALWMPFALGYSGWLLYDRRRLARFAARLPSSEGSPPVDTSAGPPATGTEATGPRPVAGEPGADAR